jgi:DNA-nicking Smr family endonuclease
MASDSRDLFHRSAREPDAPDTDEDELSLFRQAVGNVRPVGDDRAVPDTPPPPPRPRQRDRDEAEALEAAHYGYAAHRLPAGEWIDPELYETDEPVAYARPGLQHGVLRKLKRGHYRVSAELDLHGFNAEAAREAVQAFLLESRRTDRRCVKIIHGKGRGSRNRGPVLKPLVHHWLRRWDATLAYCSARPVDGGSGAIYVLLKRERD